MPSITGKLFGPRADRLEEWLRAPLLIEPTHAELDIRRAQPAEFDAIYDLVNGVFAFKRPRPLFDWLYRDNPSGKARCWVVIEKASGRLVGNLSVWPWPLARDAQPLDGALGGDLVVLPEWQGRGAGVLRSAAREAHPWAAHVIGLGWPNANSRGAGIKRGSSPQILGPLPRAVLLLRAADYLIERGWPKALGALGGAAADVAFDAWRAVRLRGRSGLTVEAVPRFTADFDRVTEQCMAWEGFWSPHGWEFLNWRYLDHPTRRYTALAVADGPNLAGYAVLGIDGRTATLMEFAAPSEPPGCAATLLLHTVRRARAAGCTSLYFFAPPRWRHWDLFRTAGFLGTPSDIFVWAVGGPPEVRDLDAWQLVPGDADSL